MTKIYISVIVLLGGSVGWLMMEKSSIEDKVMSLEAELQLEKSKEKIVRQKSKGES